MVLYLHIGDLWEVHKKDPYYRHGRTSVKYPEIVGICLIKAGERERGEEKRIKIVNAQKLESRDSARPTAWAHTGRGHPDLLVPTPPSTHHRDLPDDDFPTILMTKALLEALLIFFEIY